MQEKNSEIVKQLLKARADVHLKNSYGRTALHYAAMVRFLQNSFSLCWHSCCFSFDGTALTQEANM